MYTITTTTTTTTHVKKFTTDAAIAIPILIIFVLVGFPLIYIIARLFEKSVSVNPKKTRRLFDDDYVSLFNNQNIDNLLNDSQQCSICLSDVNVTDNDKLILNCGHMFHKDCIKNWIIVHKTCPLCRENVIFLDLK